MDGLSGAASGIAVVSLAIQLGDSVKKLCEFWASVKEAPDDVRAITADLQLLSSVLAGMAFEEQHFEPNPTLVTALEACRDNVTKLVRIANDMEPGFASKKPRIRIWTAFRAAIKGESIQKSQRILEGLKSTLTLALHNHHK